MSGRSLDVAKARADTPGCLDRIHLNNAGAALMPTPVIETVRGHLDLEVRLGGYEAEAEVADRLSGVYTSIGRLIGAGADDIALMENATHAWEVAFHSAVLGLGLGPGDVVLTGMAEYCSNYIAMIQLSRRHGFELQAIPDDAEGQISIEALESMISPAVKLITLVHVPTNGGLVNPAEAVGRVARGAGIPFFVDCAQSAGQIPLDVGALFCDVLVSTGRKFLRGPRGTAFLYVHPNMIDRLEPPTLNMKATRLTAPDDYEILGKASRFEVYESNIAAQLGLGAAVDYALATGIGAIEARVSGLAADLRSRLADIKGVQCRDRGAVRSGIVVFSLDKADPQAVMGHLYDQGINVTIIPPHMTFLDSNARDLPILMRASPHYYNTEEELERFSQALVACLKNPN